MHQPYKVAVAVVFYVACGMFLSAHAAGGLVGAAVDPAFALGDEGAIICDWGNGYEKELAFSNFLTYSTLIVAFFFPVDKTKKMSLDQNLLELSGLTTAPVLVHLIGIFIINNFVGRGFHL